MRHFYGNGLILKNNKQVYTSKHCKFSNFIISQTGIGHGGARRRPTFDIQGNICRRDTKPPRLQINNLGTTNILISTSKEIVVRLVTCDTHSDARTHMPPSCARDSTVPSSKYEHTTSKFKHHLCVH